MTNWFFYLINTKISTNFTIGVLGHSPKYFTILCLWWILVNAYLLRLLDMLQCHRRELVNILIWYYIFACQANNACNVPQNHFNWNFGTAHAQYHVTYSYRVEKKLIQNPLPGFASPLYNHMGLRWRLRSVYSWAFPLLSRLRSKIF